MSPDYWTPHTHAVLMDDALEKIIIVRPDHFDSGLNDISTNAHVVRARSVRIVQGKPAEGDGGRGQSSGTVPRSTQGFILGEAAVNMREENRWVVIALRDDDRQDDAMDEE